MSIYKYRCITCNIEYEVQRSIHEENAPYCCSTVIRQVYYAPGIELKGDRWGKNA